MHRRVLLTLVLASSTLFLSTGCLCGAFDDIITVATTRTSSYGLVYEDGLPDAGPESDGGLYDAGPWEADGGVPEFEVPVVRDPSPRVRVCAAFDASGCPPED